MYYEIRTYNGNLIFRTTDWDELMQMYAVLHRETKEPVYLAKVEE